MIEILAEKQDFEMAREIYLQLNGVRGAQMTKLTSTEQMLVDAIRASGKTEFTVKELQKLIRRSRSTISRLVAGNPQLDDHIGLLEKCPPLSYYERSEKMEDGGYQRGRIYTWDYEMDEFWSAGVSCWLDESDENNSDTGPGDDPDGSVHVCRPVQALCRTDCTNSEDNGEFISELTGENANSSSGVQTSERASTVTNQENNVLYIPEKSAHTPPKSIISQDVQEIEDIPPDSSVHDRLHTTCTGMYRMHRSDPVLSDEGKQGKKFDLTDIHPDVFFLAERIPDQICDCCGRKGVTYREKGGGKNPPGQKRRMICERCYSAAVSREVMTYRALPGVLPLQSMKQTDRSLGRCHLCHLHPVTWFDEETKIGLCERCYHRERFSNRNNAGGTV